MMRSVITINNVVIKVIALYVAICAVVFGTYLSLTYYEKFYATESLQNGQIKQPTRKLLKPHAIVLYAV